MNQVPSHGHGCAPERELGRGRLQREIGEPKPKRKHHSRKEAGREHKRTQVDPSGAKLDELAYNPRRFPGILCWLAEVSRILLLFLTSDLYRLYNDDLMPPSLIEGSCPFDNCQVICLYKVRDK